VIAPRWTWPLVALVLVFTAPPLADAGTSLARKAYRLAAQADKRARRAETRASDALAAIQPGPKGDAGLAGSPGQNGRDGAAGLDGLSGPAGAAGPAGEAGAQGAPGVASATLATATNTADVALGAEVTTRPEVVASVTVVREGMASVLVQAEGEVVETRRMPTPVRCAIDAAGEVAVREFDLAAGARELVSISAAPLLSAGTHTLALVCARGDGRTDAVAVFPAGRTRLAVLGG
jgi:hypothetical protein